MEYRLLPLRDLSFSMAALALVERIGISKSPDDSRLA